jgi:hypothetical protein
MKYFKFFKSIVIVVICLFSSLMMGQIGINTTTPQISLAISDTNFPNENNTGFHLTSTNNLAIFTEGNNRMHFNLNGIGINQNNPEYILDINANNQPIRFQNLPELNPTTFEFLVVSNSFFGPDIVGKRTIPSLNSQYMRFGLNDFNIPRPCEFGDCGGIPLQKEWAVRFDNNNEASEMGNAPNGNPNFHNSIVGAYFLENATVTAGNGTPARTTDRISLPAGVYRLTLRYAGLFETDNANNHLDLKVIVNNHEYSFANSIISGNGTSIKTGSAVETLVLNQESILDFTFVRESPLNQNFANYILSLPRIGSGSTFTYNSTVLIEKLQ